MRSLAALLALTAVLAVGRAASAEPDFSIGNFVVNGDAEAPDVTPWSGTDWATRAYSPVPVHEINNDPGKKGFAGTVTGATLVQTVSVERIAARIDAGEDLQLVFDLYLGGGPGSGGAMATLQPLDAGGHDLGGATSLGPPGPGDYYGEPGLLECHRGVTLPPATRSARVTLTAVGQVSANTPALADNIYFGGPYARSQVGQLPSPEPADAPNCERYPSYAPTPTPTATASPSPSPTVTPDSTPAPPSASSLALSRRRVSFLASGPGRFRVTVERREPVGWVLERRSSQYVPGQTRVVAFFRRLPPGRYRVTVRPPAASPVLARFQLR